MQHYWMDTVIVLLLLVSWPGVSIGYLQNKFRFSIIQFRYGLHNSLGRGPDVNTCLPIESCRV